MPERPPVPESISGCAIEGTLREGPAVLVVRARDSLGPLEIHLFEASLVEARVPKTVFFDSVRATAGLHHERLATVVNAGEKGPWWFVACKGTEGATLANLFARGHLDEERALGIFAGVAEGLAGLEAAGFRHGALDPTAIGLPGSGQVRLSLRRLVPVDMAARDPRYLSPEEARGEDGGLASDLYVLGLLLGEALFGRPLLEGSAEEIRLRVARGEVPAPSAILRGVLPQTVELVSSLLSPAARGRPGSAADTVRILRSLQAAFTSTESLEGSFSAPLAAVAVAGSAPPGWAPAAPPAARPAVGPGGGPPLALPAAPPVVAPSAAAVAMAPAARTRRAHARLVLPHRGVEQIHEILEPVTWIGEADGGRIVARGKEFAGAVARLEVGAQCDTLIATGAAPRPLLRGQEFTRVDLQFGDSFVVGIDTVTFEKAGRLLLEGEEGAEEGRSHRLREKPSKAPVVAGVLLALGALAWGGLRWSGAKEARGAEAAKARERGTTAARALTELPPPPPVTAAGERATREETALRLLDRARAERSLGKDPQARDKIESLLRLYPDTAASLLAKEDLRELRILLKDNAQEEFRGVQAQAEALAAEGRNAAAFDLLQGFADTHAGTLPGDRASMAAETLARIASDRVDDLLRAARAAADRRDWTAMQEAIRRADAVATRESRRRVSDEKERLLRGVPRGTPSEDGAPPREKRGTAVGPGTEKPPAEKPPTAKTPQPTTKDEEATELFRASREAVEAGKYGVGERGFYRLLTEFADTKVIRDYGTEALQRYEEAGKKGHFVAGLFRGDSTFKGNRVTLSWDFEDAADATDFETIHPFLVPNKGTFKVERGELAAQGAAAFVLRAGFKPDSVVMNFRIRPGVPAQDMGAMFMEPRDVLNHLMFTVANDYFRLGKGDKAYAIPGNVIFVFGKGMWKSTDAGMVGFVKTAASEDPKVEANRWTEMEVAKEKGKARWAFGGKTLTGAAVGDNKYELTGVRPALFVLLTEAHFDEVSVEGELNPEWVKAERERVFPEKK